MLEYRSRGLMQDTVQLLRNYQSAKTFRRSQTLLYRQQRYCGQAQPKTNYVQWASSLSNICYANSRKHICLGFE